MRKIRKGDEIIVIAGKDKGRRGEVSAVVADGAKVVVEGINIAKKHVKPNPQLDVQGGIVDKEMPLDVSNVALYNPESEKADRVGFRIDDGKKVRFFKSSGNAV